MRDLSEMRLDTILWVRQWHLLGRTAAEFFDNTRGVEQGRERIDELFKKKTCKEAPPRTPPFRGIPVLING